MCFLVARACAHAPPPRTHPTPSTRVRLHTGFLPVTAGGFMFGAVGREEVPGGSHCRTPGSTRGPFVLPCVPPSGSGPRLGASLSMCPTTSCAVLRAAGLTEGALSGLCPRPLVFPAGTWVPGPEGSLRGAGPGPGPRELLGAGARGSRPWSPGPSQGTRRRPACRASETEVGAAWRPRGLRVGWPPGSVVGGVGSQARVSAHGRLGKDATATLGAAHPYSACASVRGSREVCPDSQSRICPAPLCWGAVTPAGPTRPDFP